MKKNILISRGTREKINKHLVHQLRSAAQYGDSFVVVGYDNQVGDFEPESECILRNDCLGVCYEKYIKKYSLHILPLGGDVKKELNSVILEAMLMQRRFEERINLRVASDLSNHYRLVMEHIFFWNTFLETQKIDVIILSDVPHEVYDFIIFSLCKIKHIKTYIYRYLYKTNRYFVIENFEDMGKICAQKYLECKEKYKDEPIEKIVLTQSLSKFYSELNTLGKDSLFQYDINRKREFLYRFGESRIDKYIRQCIVRYKENKSSVNLNLWNYVSTFGFVQKKKRDTKELLFYYEKLSKKPIKGEAYIYFALHLLPESAVNPLGANFSDQFIAVKLISYYIPPGWNVYVKMHPAQVATVMSKEELKRFYNLSNVKIISLRENQQDLIANAKAVGTLTGEIAIESLFQNIPCLIFGETYYKASPMAYPILTEADMKHAIHEITANKTTCSDKERKIFFKAMEEATYCGIDQAIHEIALRIQKMSKNTL